ncbi:MAG: hypothetical protein G01um101418_474 [Parcubacteria group bacterium Gr01-1014_18]|nr:MAG: hypothetical protein Greene041636_520 [Parcubacteria group bacterium Greene0416_36]TSC81061.1 MAG: hypothetical protein G01um101418_474 [Parcubacteria group bacterium Gr01-1014_18]TSC98795.1 MAG: hypothetical protein Greene101420_545 [Parcubacteria group bacterium Greene1014_20]TSD06725.1 MAG: hypothetical protein Greene07142_646 [Parcubacteria group bacterium Greene0714_2]
MNTKTKNTGAAWIISASMGYGHERTAHNLRHLAPDQAIINANDYPDIPESDAQKWTNDRRGYEAISRIKKIPLVGDAIFGSMDHLQKIDTFYPQRDQSAPNLILRHIYHRLYGGWNKALIQKLSNNPLPMICTFFTPAFAAEVWKYPGDIYCIVTDSDMARHWVPLEPITSRIQYLAPTDRVAERLRLYGVQEKNIHLVGYPLPQDNIGGKSEKSLKRDLGSRLFNLDPEQAFLSKYQHTLRFHIGEQYLFNPPARPMTILYSVGGAGAQKEMGLQIAKSLEADIKAGKIQLVLSAGNRKEIAEYYHDNLKHMSFYSHLGRHIHILYHESKHEYFTLFNEWMRKVDILWTKPSELSFYAGLGIPILMAPSLGTQEDANRRWLKAIGAGITPEDVQYTHLWLWDWLRAGYLAKAAFEGFLYAPKMGVYEIEKMIQK